MEYTNNVVFEDTTVKVHVHKDLIVEGELVVHGKVTVRGYSQFEGPSARFRKDYTASKEKIDKHVYPQGRPECKCSTLPPDLIRITNQVDVAHTLEMEFKGDAYGYGEGLTFSSKDKRVVIKGNLMVDGNFVARGAVRFFEDVSLDGGAFFKNKPNVG